jgi:transmembrane sensor
MNKHNFISLLKKYLNNEATQSEERFVFDYYNLFRNEPEVLNLLNEEDRERLKNHILIEVWENIAKKEDSVRKLKSLPALAMRVAAAAAVVILISGIIFYYYRGSVTKPEATSFVNQLKENHILSLADGSTVILGPQSKIDYPTSFDGLPTREVYLEGQAFFDVHKDSAKPFIVHTGKVQTRVLGTAFNIKAFLQENDITVTVKRGKVQVADQDKTLGIITPDEQIVYSKSEQRSVQNEVNTEAFLNWKNEDLFFDNLTFTEAAVMLGDRFNVNIHIISQSIASKKFTTTIAGNQSLEVTLKSICEFNGAIYTYDKETSTIIIKEMKKTN